MGTYTVYRLTFKTQLHLGRPLDPRKKGVSVWKRPKPTYPPIHFFQRSARHGQHFIIPQVLLLSSMVTRKTRQFYLSC